MTKSMFTALHQHCQPTNAVTVLVLYKQKHFKKCLKTA